MIRWIFTNLLCRLRTMTTTTNSTMDADADQVLSLSPLFLSLSLPFFFSLPPFFSLSPPFFLSGSLSDSLSPFSLSLSLFSLSTPFSYSHPLTISDTHCFLLEYFLSLTRVLSNLLSHSLPLSCPSTLSLSLYFPCLLLSDTLSPSLSGPLSLKS